uniref:Macaca fascicularis brain cDNA clone: QflA-17461, similar to human hypothetical protein FLJ13984 (FLJ13984), mRNA, RefSeq: NM_024770.1 n=1 Tax=Macaca fascicularis TaxID=9541 RepID=I7G5E6_MACFA|nr:unnamed protein product [Macaca fascicularis]
MVAPVVPANPEAEGGGSLEPTSSRLLGAVIIPLLSTLGNKTKPCLKIKTNKQKKGKKKQTN